MLNTETARDILVISLRGLRIGLSRLLIDLEVR